MHILGESASFLAKSSYIRDLATLVISYGMAINIVEVTWKSKLKAAFPDPNSYSMFMGNFSTMTGIVTLLMMLAGTAALASMMEGRMRDLPAPATDLFLPVKLLSECCSL